MVNKIHSDLRAMEDKEYRDLNLKIANTSYPSIGIRMPELRAYAKKLLKQEKEPVFEDKYYEEVLIHGFYVAGKKEPFEEKIKKIEAFLPLIESWSICDTFVSSLKDIKKHREEYYPYVLKYLSSDEEFIQRFGLVVLLNYYIDDQYYPDLKRIVKEEDYHGYYSEMAGAWLLSYMFMKFFDETLAFVKTGELNEIVRKKGIRKALDSYQISDEEKAILRSL